jgi:copper chaperone NosL
VRRWIVTAAVLAGAVVLAVFLLGKRSGEGPETIVYGRDACAQCRMIISRPGFGGELRNQKGVLTKYDDLGCLLKAMVAERAEMPEAWVEDHAGDGNLVPLLGATLVRVPAEHTPMGHGIVAFAEESAAQSFAAEHAGEVVVLEALVHDLATVARATPPTDRGPP